MTISVEVEYEDQTDHVLYITAEGILHQPEPDVGIIYPYAEWFMLYWTDTCQEFTEEEYMVVLDDTAMSDYIEDALLENAD